MDKRGQVGMEMAVKVLLAIITVAIIGFVLILIVTSANNTAVAKTTGSHTELNETGAFINSSGYTVTQSSLPNANTFVILQARNGTDASVIASGNYTINSNGVITNASAVTWSDVQLDYSLKYNQFTSTQQNITGGVSSFFGNTGTWFALLAIVIIILIVTLVIIAVRRFGGQQTAGL